MQVDTGVGMRRWWAVLGVLVVALASVVAGCTFDSSLSHITCNQEGRHSQGRVCRDGHWLAEADATLDGAVDASLHDASDTAPDVPLDTRQDAPADGGSDADTGCGPDQTLCSGQCVDTQTSEDHCGTCNHACNTYGDHSLALCSQGTCQRACADGWVDADGDWIGAADPTTSNGCETACTPTADPTEVCDGVDNNCNGQVDEGLLTTYYRDDDGDGYGVDGDSKQLCAPDQTNNYTATQAGDCDDTAFSINPGATEVCNNIDDDCDGNTDPGCGCTQGHTANCYSGANGTEGVGECVHGTKTCDASGQYGACQGEVTPTTEVCDDQKDNDCDGKTDCDDPDCDAQSCGGGGAICHAGACCTSQNDAAFCSDQGAQCGQLSGSDNCGVARNNVNCGACPGGSTCDANNTCHENPDKCGDGQDNDGDGKVDCADDDCQAQACGDGNAHCSGYACHELTCDDGKDNDRDGLTDCEDVDDCPAGTACSANGTCHQQACCTFDKATFCGNSCSASLSGTDSCGQSQSGIDCGTCPGGSTCDTSNDTCHENTDKCGDGKDNDNDGAADCADSDCDGQSCGPGGKICYSQACCMPQSDADFCVGACGSTTKMDNCGVQRTVSCKACIGDTCAHNPDCASGYCNPAGQCGPAHCNDGSLNNGETQIDCGGGGCLGCKNDACNQNSDCKSNSCNTASTKCN